MSPPESGLASSVSPPNSKVLFLCKKLDAPSHLWMRRTLRLLGPKRTVLVMEEPSPGPGQSVLRETIASYETHFLGVRRRELVRRVRRRLGVESSGGPQLVRLARRQDIAAVLVQFLSRALHFESVWRDVDKPVFVACHGADVCWDLRRASGEDLGEPFHPADYTTRVRSLPQRVHFIANSRTSAGKLSAIGISPERIHVNYLGVPSPSRRGTSRNTDAPLKLLFLGRLVDCKGPDLVIRAFERARQLGLNARLVIAGDGPLRVTCELARERSPYREDIALLGGVDEATGERLRAEADAFTAHSCTGSITRQEEALGVSFLEAMGAGLPVVTGSSGSIPEIVEDGVHGRLFEPMDVEAHARCLLDLGSDPAERARLGSNARQRVEELFSPERELSGLLSILGLPCE